jgi:hypothetical protein
MQRPSKTKRMGLVGVIVCPSCRGCSYKGYVKTKDSEGSGKHAPPICACSNPKVLHPSYCHLELISVRLRLQTHRAASLQLRNV